MGTNQRRRRLLYKVLTLIAVVIAIAVGWFFYQPSEVGPQIKVVFDGVKNNTPLYLEVVSTPATRAKGLMFRRELPENNGMLFVFPQERVQGFWMKDTYLSLDMVFLDSQKRVIGILENVPPFSEERRAIEKPSFYTVELPGGTAQKLGIQEGAVLRILSGQIPVGS